jgi:Fur family ferric uptake transcriptional regulator
MDKKVTSKSSLSSTLHAAGKRMTSQRTLVLRILEESANHLDAEAIWEQAKSHDQTINIATVYRSLRTLQEMGLIEQRYFARDHKRETFESSQKPEHFHFSCKACGTLIEFESNHVRKVREELEVERGLHLSHTCMCFEGYCAKCAAKLELEKEQ